jgi:hypothetical protein
MNRSKLYVPNPQKWMRFFERVASGKAKLIQSGRGRRMLSVDAYTDVFEDNRQQQPVKVVTPAEQTVAQAKSELKRDDINPKVVSAALHTVKGSRGRRTSKKTKQQTRKKERTSKGQRERRTSSKKQQTRKKERSQNIAKIKQTGGRKRQQPKEKKTYRNLSKADILGF